MAKLSLKGRALRLLGMREHSRLELERKLKTHEPEPGALAQALDDLQAKGFISEQRVADSVVHRRSGKLGALRVRQELKDKGLDPELVQRTVTALQATEFERARAVWQRKFGDAVPGTWPPGRPDTAEKSRQMRFLAARGFGGDTIRQVVASDTHHPDAHAPDANLDSCG